MEWKSHYFPEFLLFQCFLFVNLVSEDNNWEVLQLWHLEQAIELSLGFSESILVCGINHENNSIDSTGIFSPSFSGLHVSSEIIRIELDIADSHLCLMRMYSRVRLGEFIALKHV